MDGLRIRRAGGANAQVKFGTEAELAAAVIAWLRSEGWECYQEVATHGGVADIVAVKARHTWIIETKLSLTFNLIGQAHWRKPYAHWTSICCPVPKDASTSHPASAALRLMGLGWLAPCEWERFKVKVAPSFTRPTKMRGRALLDCLVEEHKTYAVAGSPGGRYWSPFKETCRHVLTYVTKNPGATAKAVIESIPHHWSDQSARATLIDLTDRKLIPGVKTVREGRSVQFHPEAGCQG